MVVFLNFAINESSFSDARALGVAEKLRKDDG